MPTTLIAVSGMSPAIITETLWALAQESPAVVPDDVVIITTTKGQADIKRDLFSDSEAWGKCSVWETLRQAILKRVKPTSSHKHKLQISVRVIDLPDESTGIRHLAEDLRTKEDNDEAASFILRTLAEYCDAEDNHVIASIAGGRKTMGALLYAGMTLIGKETDRVTHVLVSEPFESCRGFFYPEQPVQELESRPFGQAPIPVLARTAAVQMADIPFVPLRNGFAELNESRRTFSGLVSRYSRDLHRLAGGKPTLSLDPAEGHFVVAEKTLKLRGRTLMVTAFLFDRARQGLPKFNNATEAEEAYITFCQQWRQKRLHARLLDRYYDGQAPAAEDIVKGLSELRKKLGDAGAGGYIANLAPERSRVGFDAHIRQD